MSFTTGSGATTEWLSTQDWNGQTVVVRQPDSTFNLCNPGVHDLRVVHHTDDEGRHYCPTGFLMCHRCLGFAEEPAPASCQFWGEVPHE